MDKSIEKLYVLHLCIIGYLYTPYNTEIIDISIPSYDHELHKTIQSVLCMTIIIIIILRGLRI